MGMLLMRSDNGSVYRFYTQPGIAPFEESLLDQKNSDTISFPQSMAQCSTCYPSPNPLQHFDTFILGRYILNMDVVSWRTNIRTIVVFRYSFRRCSLLHGWAIARYQAT